MINYTLDYINKRINDEICEYTIDDLKDDNLMDEYKKTKSVINNILELDNILKKYINENEKILIINEYILKIIPSGTKGLIRGITFNKIVKYTIEDMDLNETIFEIKFEKKCEFYKTDEIPDWYIMEKSTKKIIIGMNQIDIWSGGQQLNRGSKYILNEKNITNNSKLLCVICKKIILKSQKSKIYKLFKTGFQNNTLCYLNGLKKNIYNYFNLK